MRVNYNFKTRKEVHIFKLTHGRKKKLQFDSEDDLENRAWDLKFVKEEQNLLECYCILSVLW